MLVHPVSWIRSVSSPTHPPPQRTQPHRISAVSETQQRGASFPDTSAAHPTTTTTTTPPTTWPSAAALSAAFSSTEPEEQHDIDVSVSGRLPEWLSGRYLRNGPGNYKNGTDLGMLHMFDGYACILKLDIDAATNTVKLSHKFIGSEAYSAFKKTGKMRWREFATPVPSDSFFSKVADVLGMALGSVGMGQGVTDNASVNIIPIPSTTTSSSDGKNYSQKVSSSVWAVTETVAGTFEIDPSTLSTRRRIKYGDSLKGDLTTAHPTVLANGDMINLLSVPVAGFTVYRQPPPLKNSENSKNFTDSLTEVLPVREVVARVPHHRPLSPAWVHDFPGTNQHIVIPEVPLYFNLGALMLGTTTDHIFLDWVPEDAARLHVVNVTDGSVRSYTTPAFFCFHWANAFESGDGNFLYIDGAVYDDPEIVNHLYLKNVKNENGGGPCLPRSSLRRLKIDLRVPSGSPLQSEWEVLMDDDGAYGNFVEFPCVNPQKKGKKARFVWGTCAQQPTQVNNALVKFDMEERTCQVWHEGGGIVGEPLFIPAPPPPPDASNSGDEDEDDGVVISVVTQGDGLPALLVLDGKTHKEVARAVLPYGIVNGFHGAFIPS